MAHLNAVDTWVTVGKVAGGIAGFFRLYQWAQQKRGEMEAHAKALEGHALEGEDAYRNLALENGRLAGENERLSILILKVREQADRERDAWRARTHESEREAFLIRDEWEARVSAIREAHRVKTGRWFDRIKRAEGIARAAQMETHDLRASLGLRPYDPDKP